MSILAQTSVYDIQLGSIVFLVPKNSGATIMYTSSITAGMANANRAHNERIGIWRDYYDIMREAKQAIFNHVPETCYRTLKDKHIGCVKITYLDLFNHSAEGYSEISDNEMQENNKRIKKEITGDTHFEKLVQQIENYVENVATQNLYLATQTVSIGFNIIDKNRFYKEYCRD